MPATPTLSQLLQTHYSDVESEKEALMRWASPTPTEEKQYFSESVSVVPVSEVISIPPSRKKELLADLDYPIGLPFVWKAMVWTGVAFLFLCLTILESLSFTSLMLVLAPATWLTHPRGLGSVVHVRQYQHAKKAALWLAWLGSTEVIPFLLKALRQRTCTSWQKRWRRQAELALADLLDVLDAQVVTDAIVREVLQLVAPVFARNSFNIHRDMTESHASLCIAILRFLERTGNSRLVPAVAGDTMTGAGNQKTMPYRTLVCEVARMYQTPSAPVAGTKVTMPSTNMPLPLTRKI